MVKYILENLQTEIEYHIFGAPYASGILSIVYLTKSTGKKNVQTISRSELKTGKINLEDLPSTSNIHNRNSRNLPDASFQIFIACSHNEALVLQQSK